MFICCGMALILTRPLTLRGLPFLTYALASLSSASPSVRRLHPKSFQLASFPFSLSCNSRFKREGIHPFCCIKVNNQKRGKKAISDCWNKTHLCQHIVSVKFCLIWPLTSNIDPSGLTSTGLSTQWSDPRSNQSDSVRPRYISSNWFNMFCWVANCVCRCLLTLTNSQTTSQNDLGF